MRNANVFLSVGLPLTRFGAEKQGFIKYLSGKKEAAFRYEREKYSIRIIRVSVFPQCYAAVADRIRSFPERAVIVDIGSWTVDIMPIYQCYPEEPECITIQQGLIRCMTHYQRISGRTIRSNPWFIWPDGEKRKNGNHQRSCNIGRTGI